VGGFGRAGGLAGHGRAAFCSTTGHKATPNGVQAPRNDTLHRGQCPDQVNRIGGADRIDTAIDTSQWSYAKTGTGGRQASVAVISRSDEFADALGGSALAAQKGGPLLLTDPGSQYLPRPELDLVRTLAPHLSGVVVFGGYQAVGTVASNTAESALGRNHYYSFLNRQDPELAGPR